MTVNEESTEQGFRTLPDPVVIGVGGLLTSGKDALAEALQRHHGDYRFVIIGMSNPLNAALSTLNPIIPGERWGVFGKKRYNMRYRDFVDLHGYVRAKKNPEVRRLLQVMGTEVGRQMIDENVWVDMADRRIQEYLDQGTSVIVTGIRFRNELDMIHRRARGISIWVDRPGVDSTGEHASENSVSAHDFALTVHNGGSLEDLNNAAEFITAGGVGNSGVLTVLAGGKHFNGDERRDLTSSFPVKNSVIFARTLSASWTDPNGQGIAFRNPAY